QGDMRKKWGAGLGAAGPAIRDLQPVFGLAELAPPSALLRWSFGLLARPQFSQRRRFPLLISMEQLGRPRRAIFRAASMKPKRRMLSVLSFNLTLREVCSIRRKRSCKA